MEQIIHVPQDLTYLSWSKVRNSSGIGGSFLKAQETTPVGKVFYKLSDYTDELAAKQAQDGATVKYFTNLSKEIIDKKFLDLE